MTHSEATSLPTTVKARASEGYPREFTEAVESLYKARMRPEISLGAIRPPESLAPYSHAVGLEVQPSECDDDTVPVASAGDAFGRLIVLYDPRSEDVWASTTRLVAYIQADMDADVANDPLLPEVAWQWLSEGLDEASADYAEVAGTVTSTASVRFGDIGGVPRAFQLELRASWSPLQTDLSSHVEAFAAVLSKVAGLPPEGVSAIRPHSSVTDVGQP